MNYTSYPIILSLMDKNGNVVDYSQYLEIKLFYNRIELNEKAESIAHQSRIELKNCDRKELQISNDQEFSSLAIEKLKCISNYDFSLYGFWTDTNLSYFSIVFSNVTMKLIPERAVKK